MSYPFSCNRDNSEGAGAQRRDGGAGGGARRRHRHPHDEGALPHPPHGLPVPGRCAQGELEMVPTSWN